MFPQPAIEHQRPERLREESKKAIAAIPSAVKQVIQRIQRWPLHVVTGVVEQHFAQTFPHTDQ
jgi:hypothetical protein